MATMNISLPDKLKEWVDLQVATGRYANASDFVRDLIRRDEVAVSGLQAMIDEARGSGTVDMPLDEMFEDIKRQTKERLKAAARDAA